MQICIHPSIHPSIHPCFRAQMNTSPRSEAVFLSGSGGRDDVRHVQTPAEARRKRNGLGGGPIAHVGLSTCLNVVIIYLINVFSVG